MEYTAYSLNGAWEMAYCREKYKGTTQPWDKNVGMTVPSKAALYVEQAVPGYWEDMLPILKTLPSSEALYINPNFGTQSYPIKEMAPDMALENVQGTVFYRKEFVYTPTAEYNVLHFEGVQNSVSVWLNDSYLGTHEGYSTPFDMVVPRETLSTDTNVLVLSVSNHRLEGYAGRPIVGITSRASNEYTGGITGDVELRGYKSPLTDVAIFVSKDCGKINVQPIVDGAWATKDDSAASTVSREIDVFTWKVLDGEKVILSGETDGDFDFSTEKLLRWSPEEPKLYGLEITYRGAVLYRSFGVRRLLSEGVHLQLNGAPYFLRGICEHGHFSETIHPHHDIEVYREMIRKEKELGFNFIRFHTFVPVEEYMQAADELGMLMQVESPNNTTLSEWKEIVTFCRRHPSVVIYCCGNELLMDDEFIEHIALCGDEVHGNTDALFSPMSAMRGLEYYWEEPDQQAKTVEVPFKHHPERFRRVSGFSDLYNSYPLGLLSYESVEGSVALLDEWSSVYNKPRLSHEICIDGTYVDLSLESRYEGTRMGRTDRLPSIRRHLQERGLLERAPLYFKNSSEWQRRVRKHCFELARRCEKMAGFDFLGPIDTHWHTFGYEVGMMNEFFELKPGETIRNVRMYNSETVVLTDLETDFNFISGQEISFGVLTSYYGREVLSGARLEVILTWDSVEASVQENCGQGVCRDERSLGEIDHQIINATDILPGIVAKIYDYKTTLPSVNKPAQMRLNITLSGNGVFAENEWELYLFPETISEVPVGKYGKKSLTENPETSVDISAAEDVDGKNKLVVAEDIDADTLRRTLQEGKDVLLLGAGPFNCLPTSFRIGLAGRTSGNLATVIEDHSVFRDFPHEGFCGWQFRRLLEGGNAICFEQDDIPFHPIVDVASTHKYAIRQAAVFECAAWNGRLFVCGFHFDAMDPAAAWLRQRLLDYVDSPEFAPTDAWTPEQFDAMTSGEVVQLAQNTNFAVNANDITARTSSS